uniref:NAD(P)(+) transhydrogenase (Si-specific) n=1 Tax=Tetraselmis sp. GSL018 TaxID=582737 RepID=A0A061RXG1_9CHLO|eukprot:CAMPEP_0177615164 /NCGR_PEP_ID=MMETSP0419_2-20121207/23240_1 /TAXON_ID=582737 /ORGANISM="Tetraselmis sp., Strain GSL018" /LENGTH=721 /DNA_ID=CAMNT_0019112665 /DNA_START=42 /DNA_END=2207 /DNA_ORIENTATION=-
MSSSEIPVVRKNSSECSYITDLPKMASLRPELGRVKEQLAGILNQPKDDTQLFRIKSRAASKRGGNLEEQKKRIMQMLEEEAKRKKDTEKVEEAEQGEEEEGLPPKRAAPAPLPAADEEAIEEADLEAIAVIGGGPTGVQAALKAAYMGKRVLLIDAPKGGNDAESNPFLGGPTGLFSKALRDVGKQLNVSLLRNMQIHEETIWMQVQAMCTELALSNALHSVSQLRDFGVSLLTGWATVKGSKRISVRVEDIGEALEVSAENILIATGSSAMVPSSLPRLERVFDSDTINGLSFLPKSIVIQGGGIIALEYAKIFVGLTTSVTVLIRGDAVKGLVSKGLDPDVARMLIQDLQDSGIGVMTGTTIKEVKAAEGPGGAIVISVSQNGEERCLPPVDALLVALGRKPNTKGFGLEEAGVRLDERSAAVAVDSRLQTSVPFIYAAGDVLGAPLLASTGVEQAFRAVDNMFGEPMFSKACAPLKSEGHGAEPMGVNPNALTSSPFCYPIGVWTSPEVAYFGMTLSQAVAAGYELADEGLASYKDSIRGRVFAPKGMLKLIFNKVDGVVLGVHILGQDACELIHFGMELVHQRKTIFEIMNTIFTAVTYHELYKMAAIDANSKLQLGIKWEGVIKGMTALFKAKGVSQVNFKPIHAAAHSHGPSSVLSGRLDESLVASAFYQATGIELAKEMVQQIVHVGDLEAAESVDKEDLAMLMSMSLKRLAI